ncbi:putative membrane protein (TIGR02226 family) [Flavobacterium cauense R2A-7]|uniref:Putative membrane protein (TIGR02226 family) n=1 Tax=Flavobacterium cauense R2A-7 TaxID=1341154 RepID=A0A562LVS9_9FLAO|nr:BatA and WFA domain-containing protein [Flavobacterium cauense]KGO80613.1 membrane protein [Flavobacterium cauense R2A-7]TWI11759.1 putative membrane protein (TIGR02226 family) [Flavobacterium cauense R2A-7]
MQFKHPEILYFLFLLVIPILVHLFQLRRFKTEYFTNVRFLKELSIQTRKSSKIKKWLLLATRLLLLACLIIAFAQPFFKAKDSQNSGNEMVIILDNSFSMQAKGNRGELLKRAVQELLENTPENQRFSLVTNTETFWDTDIKSIQKDLQNLQYSATPFQLDFLLTKIETKKHNTPKDIFIITDAVNAQSKSLEKLNENSPVYYWIPKAENQNNVSIDAVSISGQSETFYEIKVDVNGFGAIENDIPMSVYNGKNLIAKTVVKLENNKKSVQFSLPKKDFHGYVSIEDKSLTYDNTYYFSISKPEKSNVIVIGENPKNEFLSRIYTPDEFNYTSSELNAVDYNAIDKQDAIVLNEIKDIPQALTTTLKAFYEKGGNVVLIPSSESSAQNLNSFLNNFSGIKFGSLQNQEKQVTKIAFSHPLYQTVFEKKTDNFQYPKVSTAFSTSGAIASVLNYADQSFFLGSTTNKIGHLYVFSAPINKNNSNFQNSPLIVPTFYNMAQNNQKTGISAYTIGENQNLVLDVLLSKDEVVTITNETSDFIPMQQILNNKIKLAFGDYPEQSGNFSVMKNKEVLKNISFNHARTESDLSLINDNLFDKFTSVSSVEAVFNDIHSTRTGNEIWKYFIIATLLFLLLELLIQKFVK